MLRLKGAWTLIISFYIFNDVKAQNESLNLEILHRWQAINVKQNDTASIICKLNGERPPGYDILWKSPNNQINSSRLRIKKSFWPESLMITIESPKPEDEGIYRCGLCQAAKNDHCIASNHFSLTLFRSERQKAISCTIPSNYTSSVREFQDAMWSVVVYSTLPKFYSDTGYLLPVISHEMSCTSRNMAHVYDCQIFMKNVSISNIKRYPVAIFNEIAVVKIDLWLTVYPNVEVYIDKVPEVYISGESTHPSCHMKGGFTKDYHDMFDVENDNVWEFVECDYLKENCSEGNLRAISDVSAYSKTERSHQSFESTLFNFAPAKMGILYCLRNVSFYLYSKEMNEKYKHAAGICVSDGPSMLTKHMSSELIEGNAAELSCRISHCNYNSAVGIFWTHESAGEISRETPIIDGGKIEITYGVHSVNSTIKVNSLKHGVYYCHAEPLANQLNMEWFHVNPRSNAIFITIISVITTTFLVLVAVGGYGYYKKQQELTKKNLEALLNLREGDVPLLNEKIPLHEQAVRLPFDSSWEFPREKLKLDSYLGAGFFGVVMKAEACGIISGEEKTTVAVKMAKRYATEEMLAALVGELKIMSHLGRHPNVVNLLGAVVDRLAENELMIIVELCPHGNLATYLSENKHRFVDSLPLDLMYPNNVADDVIRKEPATLRRYANIASVYYARHDNLLELQPLNIDVLIYWSFQIARGMEWLASRRVLHGDLAARNVLLSARNFVKISDFGLSRSIYYDYISRDKMNVKLPVKWLALESLQERKFSTKSDVWSFGVTLWELFSLALSPYPEFESFREVWRALLDGYRMPKPDIAPSVIYEVMLNCWAAEPQRRPTFTDLSRSLFAMLNTTIRAKYLEVEEKSITFDLPKHDVFLRTSHEFKDLPKPEYVDMKINRSSSDLNAIEYMRMEEGFLVKI